VIARRLRVRRGVDAGIDPHPVAHVAAEQHEDRHAERLAEISQSAWSIAEMAASPSAPGGKRACCRSFWIRNSIRRGSWPWICRNR
jgi:hypothetical protein